jgi:hypothetical protein
VDRLKRFLGPINAAAKSDQSNWTLTLSPVSSLTTGEIPLPDWAKPKESKSDII